MELFARSAIEDLARLETYDGRVAEATTLIALDERVVARSFDLREAFDLDMQDAFVLASVVVDLEDRPGDSWFVTRNIKDFDDREVRRYLDDRGCGLLTGFGDAVGAVLHNG